MTIVLSLQSFHRYETKSTVTNVELNYHLWNTSLPAITVCPLENRIDKNLFNEYCDRNGIGGTIKDEFYEFLDSLANSTYGRFKHIKVFGSTEVINLFFKLFFIS